MKKFSYACVKVSQSYSSALMFYSSKEVDNKLKEMGAFEDSYGLYFKNGPAALDWMSKIGYELKAVTVIGEDSLYHFQREESDI